MPLENETRLEWIVTGLKDIQAMSKALLQLSSSQTTAGKSVTHLNSATKALNQYLGVVTKINKATAGGLNLVGGSGRIGGGIQGQVDTAKQLLNITEKIQKVSKNTSGNLLQGSGRQGGGIQSAGVLDATTGMLKYDKAVQNAAKNTDRLADNTRKASTASKGLGLSLAGIVRAAAGFTLHRIFARLSSAIGEALTQAAEFQIKIGEIRTISQGNQQSFSKWADDVRRLSDEFNKTPLDVAEGLYQGLSNQIGEGAEATNFMNEALRLSKITVSSTSDSVKALTGSINAYGLSAGDARFVSDLLFKTVELGRTRLGELANTIGSVQVLAGQLGITIQETSAAIDVLSIQGISATKSQTLLRAILLKLIKPTDALQEVFDKLGTETGENTIATFGFAGTLDKMREAAAEGGDELAELGKQLGRVRAIIGVAGTNTDDLRDALLEMRTAGKSATVAFGDIVNVTGEKFQKQLQQISNFINIELGQEAVENIVALSDAVGGLANRFKDFVKILKSAAVATNGLFTVISAVVRIRRHFDDATKSVSQFSDAISSELTTAIRESAAEEARVHADRLRTQLNVIRIVRQKFLQSIAAQKSKILEITALEEQRNILSDKIFAIRLKKAGLLGKEELLFRKMLSLRKEAKKIADAEVLDAEALNDVLVEAQATFALTSQLKNKAGSVSRRDVALEKRRINNIALGVRARIKLESKAFKAQLRANEASTNNAIIQDKLAQALAARQQKAADDRVANVAKVAKAENSLQSDLLKLSGFLGERQTGVVGGLAQAFSTGTIEEALAAAKEINIVNTKLRQTKELSDEVGRLVIQSQQDSSFLTGQQLATFVNKLTELRSSLILDSARLGTSEKDTQEILDLAADLKTQLEIIFAGAFTTGLLNNLEAAGKAVTDNLAETSLSAAQTVKNHETAAVTSNRIIVSSYDALNIKLDAAIRKTNGLADAERRRGNQSSFAFGGQAARFANGGSVGSDTVDAKLSVGETVMNKRISRELFPQLTALNSGAARFNEGGNVTNNNVGDVNVSVNGGDTSEATVREIGNKLRRELSRGTLRLN